MHSGAQKSLSRSRGGGTDITMTGQQQQQRRPALPAHYAAFLQRRAGVLEGLADNLGDKSRKGSVDVRALPIIHAINEGYAHTYTTSSCSGRISVFGEPTAETRLAGKKGGEWVYASHDPADVDEVLRLVHARCGSGATLVFRFEPFLLHCECLHMEAAQRLLTLARLAGFRESGATQGSGANPRVMVGIRCSIKLEVPVADEGRMLVPDEYLRYLVAAANRKFDLNTARMQRLQALIQQDLLQQQQPGLAPHLSLGALDDDPFVDDDDDRLPDEDAGGSRQQAAAAAAAAAVRAAPARKRALRAVAPELRTPLQDLRARQVRLLKRLDEFTQRLPDAARAALPRPTRAGAASPSERTPTDAAAAAAAGAAAAPAPWRPEGAEQGGDMDEGSDEGLDARALNGGAAAVAPPGSQAEGGAAQGRRAAAAADGGPWMVQVLAPHAKALKDALKACGWLDVERLGGELSHPDIQQKVAEWEAQHGRDTLRENGAAHAPAHAANGGAEQGAGADAAAAEGNGGGGGAGAAPSRVAWVVLPIHAAAAQPLQRAIDALSLSSSAAAPHGAGSGDDAAAAEQLSGVPEGVLSALRPPALATVNGALGSLEDAAQPAAAATPGKEREEEARRPQRVGVGVRRLDLGPSGAVLRGGLAGRMRQAVRRLLEREGAPPDVAEALLEDLPRRWGQVGDVALLPHQGECLRHPEWDRWFPSAGSGGPGGAVGPAEGGREDKRRTLLEAIARALGVGRLARHARIANTGTRDSQAVMLLGDARLGGWTRHREHQVTYVLDVTRCMFSAGNHSERRRMCGLPAAGETVVDLFTGIGYWTLPLLARAGAAKVYACEWNPAALECLARGLEANRVTDRCEVRPGDCRHVAPRGVADRVLLGLLPTSDLAWPAAVAALKDATGGVLHVHSNVLDADEAAWVERMRGDLQRLCASAPGKGPGWTVRVAHVERVKWYAPCVRHVVVDVLVRPPGFAPA